MKINFTKADLYHRLLGNPCHKEKEALEEKQTRQKFKSMKTIGKSISSHSLSDMISNLVMVL